nr:hypothetical protein [Tanacetum cinerariifolium]
MKEMMTNVVIHGPLRKRLDCAKAGFIYPKISLWVMRERTGGLGLSEEVPEILQVREEKKNKRYKSSDSSSFYMRELREGSINLNNTVGDKEDEVENVRRNRPIHRDQANGKVKAGSTATNSFVV